MNELAKLQDQLAGVRSSLEIERDAANRGSTMFSRIPGLMAEQERLEYAIELAKEPKDGALELARMIHEHRAHNVLVIARVIREYGIREAREARPVAWMYTDSWGTHFTEDQNDILDALGILSVTPLYSAAMLAAIAARKAGSPAGGAQ